MISMQYDAKRLSADAAVSRIISGDTIQVCGEPPSLLDALGAESERLAGTALYVIKQDKDGYLEISKSVVGESERPEQVPTLLSNFPELVEFTIRPKVLLTRCSPMDDAGFFTLDSSVPGALEAVECGADVYLEVNRDIPAVGGDRFKIHLSRISGVWENSTETCARLPKSILDEDRKIAEFAAGRVLDGSVIGIGAGVLPNLVCLYLENRRDMGVHTPVLTDALINLIKKGVVNNSGKELFSGVSVCGYASVSAESREFLSANLQTLVFKDLAWLSAPSVINELGNMIYINESVMVDFNGQCTRNIGETAVTRVNGSLDFIRGARRSTGGESLTLIRSVMVRDGKRVSAIVPVLMSGSVVDIPRSDVMSIVTEFGVADLRYRSLRERAEALISVAHPDFRDELKASAGRMGLM